MRSVLWLVFVSACTSSGSATDDCPAGLTPVTIEETEIRDHYVRLDLSYSGGCAPHEFAVWWTGVAALSDPPQIPLELQHYDHGDACEAIEHTQLWIDLSELHGIPGSEAVVQFVQGTGGVGNQLGSIDYTFAAPAAPPAADVIAIDRSCGVIGQ